MALTNVLDHIIYLAPPGRLEDAVKRFTDLGFTVVSGGEHADGLTYNALVALQDGVYLELIAFTHQVDFYPENSPERSRRENHWWANKSQGWIDWANLGLDVAVADTINDRAGSPSILKYQQPIDGGRRNSDGEEIKWRVTFPEAHFGRGAIPFFCEDLTPRARRVPTDKNQHQNGAVGVAIIELQTSIDNFAPLSRQLSLALGQPPVSSTATQAKWRLLAPSNIGQHSQSSNRIPQPELLLTAAASDDEGNPDTPKVAIAQVAFTSGQYEQGSGDPHGNAQLNPAGRLTFLAPVSLGRNPNFDE